MPYKELVTLLMIFDTSPAYVLVSGGYNFACFKY